MEMGASTLLTPTLEFANILNVGAIQGAVSAIPAR
jgi:hypothetical protein